MTAAIDRPTAARTGTSAPAAAGTPTGRVTRYVLGGLRLALGWVFLWAFVDKLFGLGFATPGKNAWIDGGSPTNGFLGNAVSGPFEGFYHSFAGAAAADWLFMTGLAAIGFALVLGAGVRIAAVAGSVLLVAMWSAVLPPENNPFMDDHLVYAGVLALLALTSAGDTLGIGVWWSRRPIVRRLPWLR